ncbi:zf-CCHC domain-containing protein [Tanacetum coccineum]
MPNYAKFMKDLLTNKAKFKETSKVTLNERCSAILLNEIPLKEKDPKSFTIPCAIGKLGELKPTSMCIELANKSTQYSSEIVKNVIVKIDKFIFFVDFVVLDMEEHFRVPIILGRPFLATAHAIIDETLPKDQLDSFLFEPIKDRLPSKDINLWEDESEIDMDEEKLQNSLDSSTTPGLFSVLDDLELDDFKNPTLFAASTTDEEKKKGLAFTSSFKLSKHKAALAWKVADIKVMSKTVVYTDHSALKYLFSKQDAKPRLIRLENPELEELDKEVIRDSFPDEHLMAIYIKEPEKDP